MKDREVEAAWAKACRSAQSPSLTDWYNCHSAHYQLVMFSNLLSETRRCLQESLSLLTVTTSLATRGCQQKVELLFLSQSCCARQGTTPAIPVQLAWESLSSSKLAGSSLTWFMATVRRLFGIGQAVLLFSVTICHQKEEIVFSACVLSRQEWEIVLASTCNQRREDQQEMISNTIQDLVLTGNSPPQSGLIQTGYNICSGILMIDTALSEIQSLAVSRQERRERKLTDQWYISSNDNDSRHLANASLFTNLEVPRADFFISVSIPGSISPQYGRFFSLNSVDNQLKC